MPTGCSKPERPHCQTRRAAVVAGLAFVLAGSGLTRAGGNSEASTAKEMMVRAHAARAEWDDFPGFTAQVAVVENASVVEGRLEVAADGTVTLNVPDSPQAQWAERKLRSLVRHRRPTEGREWDVSFASEDETHPLGRKVVLNGDRMNSVYRIQGNVIREVHRTLRGTRFSISVVEVAWNDDDKYLPRTYTVSYWDAKTGTLKKTETTFDEWTRVGDFDLPSRVMTITADNAGNRTVREIRLRDHELSN